MKKYKKQIYLFLFVSLLIVIGSFSFLFINFRKQLKLQNEILKFEKNRILADSLTNNLLQIESDKRGFQLTSDTNYLKNFYALKANINDNIVNLKQDIIGEENGEIILQIDTLLKLRIANLDSGIVVFTSKGFNAAIEFMQLKSKKNIRELLNHKLVLLKSNLQSRLSENAFGINKRSNQNVTDLLILVLLSILLMFIAAYTFRKSQQKILKNHIKFIEAQRIAKIGSWEWEIASNKLTWSTEQFRLFGEDRKSFDLTYQGYLNHLSEKEQEKTKALIKDALEGKANYAIEHEIIRKDGTTLIVFEQGTVLFDKDNNPIGMFGTTQDITERKRAEEALHSTKEQYRQIVETAQEGIWVLDENNYTIFVNKRMCEMLEYTREEMMGKQNYYFKDEEGKKKAMEDIERRKMGITETQTSKFIAKSGKVVWTSLSTNPIFNDEGKYIGALGMFADITKRKEADEELALIQKKFQSIFENTADGIYQSTVDGKFITANPGAARIFGYDSPTELICSVSNIGEQLYVNQEDRKLMGDLLSKYDHLENYEVPLLTKNGAEVWVSESTRIVRDEKGNIMYYEGTLKDITERKRIEEALGSMQKKYQAIFDNTAIGIYQSSMDGKFLMANPSMARIFGYDSPADLIRSVTNISSQIYADPEERKKMIELMTLYGHIENFELQALAKNKRIIWLSANIRAVRDEKGAISYFEGLLEDITERKKAEEQLIQLSNRLQLAIRATNIGIWDWDIVNDKTEWDDEMYHIYNVDPQDAITITKSWTAAMHPDDLERVNVELQMAVTGEKEFDSEFRVIWKNKTIHYVKANAIVLRDQSGNPMRMIGTNADVTQRKEAEEEILQLNRELDQFANITAHDLQEPIRMVSGFLGLLEKKYNNVLDEQGKSYVFRAKDGADRMTILIRDLLEFSRSGNKAAKKEPVDLAVVMDLVKKDLSIVMSDTGATFQVPTSLPTVTGTSSALYRLFLNLTSNGIKFRKKDSAPCIRLCVKELTDSYEFTLQDNGIGVAEKDQPRLFQAFQRLHRREEYPGTGLGLVTCKKIVETHGGKIWMTSELGKGTTFHFTINKRNNLINE
jgi:PAS domain S-box-containing protein